MKQKKHKVLLSIEEQVEQYYQDTNDFIHAAGLYSRFNPKNASQLSLTLLDDILSGKMEWARRSRNYEALLESTFNWYDNDGSNKVSIAYLDIMDEHEHNLGNVLDLIIPRKTWQVWSLLPTATNEVVLELELNGVDYRIHDWTMKTRSGIWRK